MRQLGKMALSGIAVLGLLMVAFRFGADKSARESQRLEHTQLEQAAAAYAREITVAGAEVDWPQVLQRIRLSVPQAVDVALFDAEGQLVSRASTDDSHPDNTTSFIAPRLECANVLHMPLSTDEQPWGEIQIYLPKAIPPERSSTMWTLSDVRDIPPSLWLGGLGAVGLILRSMRRKEKNSSTDVHLTKALDSLSEGITVLDGHGRILSCNASFSEMTGSPIDDLIGRKLSDLAWNRNGWEGGYPWEIASKQGKDVQRCVVELNDAKSNDLTLSINVARIHDESSNVRGFLVSCENTTEIEKRNATVLQLLNRLEKSRYQLEAQGETLRRQAVLDSLTQCLNRAAITVQCEKEFGLKSSTKPLSCIVLGVDQLHAVNAAHGNEGGDSVLLEVARLLHKTCGDTVKVARYGGDEFFLLLPQTSVDDALKLAEQIRRDIVELKIGPMSVTASFGVSSTSMSVESYQQLCALAEHGLRVAKMWGRNQVRRGDQHPDTIPTPTVRKLINESWDADGQQEPSSLTTEALLIALRAQDVRVAAHSRRVASLATTLARGLLAPTDLAVLRTVALLHEIGRLGHPAREAVADSRPATGSLSALIPGRNFDPLAALNIELGDRVGEEILMTAFRSPRVMAVFAGFRAPRYIVRDHLIPLGARILQVAHAYDELAFGSDGGTEPRDPARVLTELRDQSGVRFEPAIVERLAKFLLTDGGDALGNELPMPERKTAADSVALASTN